MSRYEVWTVCESTRLHEGSFDTLLQALPFAQELGEASLVLDTEIPTGASTWVCPDRVCATVTEHGDYVLQAERPSVPDLDIEPTKIDWYASLQHLPLSRVLEMAGACNRV